MTRKQSQPINILMADDDEDDRLLTVDALKESRVLNNLFCVEDGVELLEFLRHEGKYSDPASAPRPSLILLDLNMPRKDGREALQELKNDPKLRSIPVVILTTYVPLDDLIAFPGSPPDVPPSPLSPFSP